jgi:predicted transglutaminase-like cysteine proteinase
MALAVLGGGALTQTKAALPAAVWRIARTGAATPIRAWVQFCQHQREECAVDPSEPATITLAPQAWQTLIRVNGQVNAAIKPMTDTKHWGVDDHWDLAEDGYGDCEDYQLVKRKRLVEAGFPRRALRMTVVMDEQGAGHAVMMVRTDRGDFILDNKRNAVLSWNQTGYTYVKREGDTGSTWASLEGAFASPIATAGR